MPRGGDRPCAPPFFFKGLLSLILPLAVEGANITRFYRVGIFWRSGRVSNPSPSSSIGDKTRGEPYDVIRNHMVPPLVLSACYLMPPLRSTSFVSQNYLNYYLHLSADIESIQL
eukprot:SAG22_NODE_1356_length_4631_cov_2.105693_6_plen_114_part_00